MSLSEDRARFLYGIPLAITGAVIIAYQLDANAPFGWLLPRYALGVGLLLLGSARVVAARWLPRKVVEYHDALSLAVVLALFLRTFCVQAFKIPSGSMEPTLLVGDHLLVNKMLYGIWLPGMDHPILTIREPQRGDIVVFRYPRDERRDFIKRLIGLPGDVIEIRDKVVYVNGKRLHEPYARWRDPAIYPRGSGSLAPRDNFGPYTVPPGHYFFMGDNRDNSHDSRFWGTATRKELIGKAMIIYLSCDPATHLPRLSRTGMITR
ncbi:MAG: signal peptidase I [Nitrospirae bacterium]|nr:MAG: signal peptidase I [Nitrospirota bacterium]